MVSYQESDYIPSESINSNQADSFTSHAGRKKFACNTSFGIRDAIRLLSMTLGALKETCIRDKNTTSKIPPKDCHLDVSHARQGINVCAVLARTFSQITYLSALLIEIPTISFVKSK